MEARRHYSKGACSGETGERDRLSGRVLGREVDLSIRVNGSEEAADSGFLATQSHRISKSGLLPRTMSGSLALMQLWWYMFRTPVTTESSVDAWRLTHRLCSCQGPRASTKATKI